MNIKSTLYKRGIVFTSDILMTVISFLGVYWLLVDLSFKKLNIFSILIITIMQAFMYLFCGLYRGIWRFASIPDLIRITQSVLLGAISIFFILEVTNTTLSLKIYITYSILLIILLSSPRLMYRWFHDYRKVFKNGKRVLVVGAGSAGEGIIRELLRSSNNEKFIPVAFVDDNRSRQGCEVHGIRILGQCKDIPILVKKLNIDLVLISIPSAGSDQMREIVNYCEQSKISFRTLPSLKDITDGKVKINYLREVLLEDLLGREEVMLDWEAIRYSIFNKTILVTGGGGSIGSELCRQISYLYPSKLIIIENNEFNLYKIDTELRKLNKDMILQSHLCSVTDTIELNKIFDKYNPELVFHVAAYKHVPLLETHIRVSMYNNIIGTRNVAVLSSNHNVKTFVLISTDKAVNPTNIMGATKRASEVFCQNLNLYSNTQFITVRFGNVLNSTGSVIPLFRQQLNEGGPLTVTHKEISRYFMTIPEASRLILQAATMYKDGEIFVLDMGEPINIRYLAEQMIILSGKVVDKDIQIKYIGLRSGEKLHEELFHANEEIYDTSHPKIKRAKIRLFNWLILNKIIDEISIAYDQGNEKKLKELLYKLVPEYGEIQKPREILIDDNVELCSNDLL
jgi:FlaA1/EpsC-like NDP-sugar epimerase